ncbi:MAG: c-type cytochrome, partial [Phycisphaerae bacterium]|nr:c-type cytochrome [Phycisphaerae bacterium]
MRPAVGWAPLLLVLSLISAPVWGEEVDAVVEGKKAFATFGCTVCHATDKNDNSVKTGPNLYGLFLNEARERQVMNPADKKVVGVRADKKYFDSSVRKSWDVLAVAERGPTRGTAYAAIMPMYSADVIPDQAVEQIWHYLRTRADAGQAGPAVMKMTVKAGAKPKNLLAVANEVVVTKRPRVFRAPVRGSSGRALHVGLPNGMNYTFDPRMLSVRNIWGGGFLNLSEERRGRGKPGSRLGQGARVFLNKGPILQPLTSSGELVDFEFKEPDVLDHKAIERYVWDDRDFMQYLSGLDAEFLGHRLDGKTGDPNFQFRVGSNRLSQQVKMTDDGGIEIELTGVLKADQAFKVGSHGLADITVSAGEVREGTWTLTGRGRTTARLKARLAGAGLVARPTLETAESFAPQPLVTAPAKSGRQPLDVPAGYAVEDWQAPKDLYGRSQLFEPTGIALAGDGTVVIATRTAGIWRIRNRKWSLFAEGTYECLGVVIEDGKGDRIVVAQKPELTRIIDTDADGRADRFETVCDDYGFHGNYHEYCHGPARDKDGNYYFSLNLSHGGSERVSWRAGGPYMGSMGGYRGWACRVTPAGKFEPFANGLRSPAGIGVDPAGRLWYAENQGEYVGSSKVVPLEKGKFYGHLSGLITLPGMKPDSSELKFENWKDKIRKGAVWLPHGKMANSPGHPAWDTTDGKFGPYAGQMFIGDQTLSILLRVVTEQVRGADQGCVIPFARGLSSGVMRPCFLPDGSLLLGQTGRGWGARGGAQAALQRVHWDGKTVAAELHRISAAGKGLVVHFTRPLSPTVTDDALAGRLKVGSWFYTNTSRYGSPEHDRRTNAIAAVKIAGDRKSALLELEGFGDG